MQYALICVILKNGIRKNLLYHEDTDGVINNILGTSYKLALLRVFLNKLKNFVQCTRHELQTRAMRGGGSLLSKLYREKQPATTMTNRHSKKLQIFYGSSTSFRLPASCLAVAMTTPRIYN